LGHICIYLENVVWLWSYFDTEYWGVNGSAAAIMAWYKPKTVRKHPI